MTDNTGPIVVNPSALPGMGGVAVRYAGALLAGWLIRRGIIADSDAALVEGLLLAIATIGYAMLRTYQQKQKLVTVARAAPDHVAVVTEPTPPPAVEPIA